MKAEKHRNTISETVIRFLNKEKGGKTLSLRSTGEILESGGVPIAKWVGDEIVMLRKGWEERPNVKAKHIRLLWIMATSHGIPIEYEIEQ